jgi:DNA-binding XRE family transcriptional regulator
MAPKISLDRGEPECYLGHVLRGEQMRAVREANGLTQEQLADMLGISRAYVARMESGDKRINQRTAIAFAAVINQHKSGTRRTA